MAYKVKHGKRDVSCHKLKRGAKARAESMRERGMKKVRVVKVKSCS